MHEVTLADLKQLDAYEDEHNEYIRTDVQVTLHGSGLPMQAFIYAKGPAMTNVLESTEWSCDEFAQSHLAKWCADIEKGDI